VHENVRREVHAHGVCSGRSAWHEKILFLVYDPAPRSYLCTT
jgi:hypothetical protein